MNPLRNPEVAAALLAWLSTPTSIAGVLVVGTVTPLGGSYLYEASVKNSDAIDYLLVSLMDAPPSDPLISPSLTVPGGFLGSYDSGLGIVDWLSDADLFAAGVTNGKFLFESLTPPDRGFSVVEARDGNLDPVAGTVQWTVIPEPATAPTAIALGLLAGVAIRRRRSR